MESTEMSEAIVKLQEQVSTLKSADVLQWESLEALRERLPNWAVVLISIEGAVIGFMANALIICLGK